jgi:hypothetical protein
MKMEVINKNIEKETKEIIKYFEGDKINIQRALENQFSVIYQRSQILLSLCGIVISVTGFSGKTIATTNYLSRILLISGLAFVLISGAITIWGIISIKWITQFHEENLNNIVFNVLKNRNLKTFYFRISILFLIIGLTMYVISISIMLLVI